MSAEGILASCTFIEARSPSPHEARREIKVLRSFSFICAAAFLVKVTARTVSRSPPPCKKSHSFCIITKVLPDPAEAETIILPRACIAAACSGV